MNEKEFGRYIEKTRDCDPALLDIAVLKGVRRGRNERLDYRKFLHLAAACVVTAMLCVMLTSQPVGIALGNALGGLTHESALITQSGSEALHKHLTDFTNGLIILLGG